MDGAFFAHEYEHDERGVEAHAGDGGDGYAGDAHAHPGCEEDVESDVDGASGQKDIEGSGGVADAAQHGSAEVIDGEERESQKDDAQIGGCAFDDLRRGAEQFEQGTGEDGAENHRGHAAREGEDAGGGHGAGGGILVAPAYAGGHDDVDAHAKAQKQRDNQVYDRPVGTYGRQGAGLAVSPDYERIGRVERLLHDAGGDQRERKTQCGTQERSGKHVDRILLFHTVSGLCRQQSYRIALLQNKKQ